MTRRNWRRTSFKRPDGTAGVAKDDWTLSDDAGRDLARIYCYLYGANAGRWFWTVLIAPDGTPFNAGSGFAATEAEAREICEAMIPPGVQERGSCCDEGGEPVWNRTPPARIARPLLGKNISGMKMF